MSINPRQKFKIVDTGLIFNVSKELYPRIEITFIATKKVQIIEVKRFDTALLTGKIKKLSAKSKPKQTVTNNFFINYRIERELCFLNEGIDNIYEQLIKEK